MAPAYGKDTLADLGRSLFAALGVAGLDDPVGIGPLGSVCLLLVDGLGWRQLQARRDRAPFLSTLMDRPDARRLSAGFPATTATSLTSIGTGLSPGEHGMVGYTFALPDLDRPINALRWEPYGRGRRTDLRSTYPPEWVQPNSTLFERAAAQGVDSVVVGSVEHVGSGLTQAVFRGARMHPGFGMGDVATASSGVLAEGSARFAYAYHANLDTTAHVRGAASEAWSLELAHVDRLAADLAERLPPGSALVVTGDHGIVDVAEADRIDLGDRPELVEGVAMVGGEGRVRHLYTEPGAEGDVLATWRGSLGDRMWIISREEAVEARWFGPAIGPEARLRIGDVVAAARDRVVVVQREVDPIQASLVGHHGSFDPVEQQVPFLIHRA
ncbi:MAG TPA: nucleotide pyrophosphatase/phosphodiesterase family protein [Actinomycetota bacterium]